MQRMRAPKSKVVDAARLMAERSVKARKERWGEAGFRRRMQEWGKLGGRPPKVSGKKKGGK
jgi:hypothetical protein